MVTKLSSIQSIELIKELSRIATFPIKVCCLSTRSYSVIEKFCLVIRYSNMEFQSSYFSQSVLNKVLNVVRFLEHVDIYPR